MTQGPIFSVVVVAHDRREYLLGALKSISRQTLPKEFFEVIIVKNFIEKTIDEFAKTNGYEIVATDVVPVGAKMSIGIEKSKGEYIVFLEDDDLFEESKLAHVLAKIEQEKVGFIHNSFELIDEQERIIPSTAKGIEVYFQGGKSYLATCKKVGIQSDAIVLSSCMIISRQIISRYLEVLVQIQAAPDLFILTSFIASSFSGIHLKEKLTRYRLHRSLSNRSGSENEFIDLNRSIRESWVLDYTLMRKTFDTGEANEIAEYFFFYNSLFELVLRDERSIFIKFIHIAHLVKSVNPFHYYSSVELIFLGLLSVISPRLSHKVYFNYRKSNYVSTFL